jgi:ABC-type antimicrobial peptide transport system permease subunit
MSQSVHDEVAALDPEIPMFDAKTLEEHVGISLFLQRMAATLLSIFGLLALSLAAIGLYGVMAYSVSQRTRELGIRVSVGAERRDIFKLILGQGLALSVVGLLAGLIASLAATRLTANLLYGVSAGMLLPGAPGDQDRPDDCVASRITHSAGFETIPYRSNSAQFAVPFHASCKLEINWRSKIFSAAVASGRTI